MNSICIIDNSRLNDKVVKTDVLSNNTLKILPNLDNFLFHENKFRTYVTGKIKNQLYALIQHFLDFKICTFSGCHTEFMHK